MKLPAKKQFPSPRFWSRIASHDAQLAVEHKRSCGIVVASVVSPWWDAARFAVVGVRAEEDEVTGVACDMPESEAQRPRMAREAASMVSSFGCASNR